MHEIDAPNHDNNEFTDGDVALGILATVVWSKWLNTIQRELVAVCEYYGLTLDDEDDAQVIEAITGIIAAHTALTNNPHSVTLSQLGVNATAAEINSVCDARPLRQVAEAFNLTVAVTTFVQLLTLDLGAVAAGDVFSVHFKMNGTKGGTAGLARVNVQKGSGSASIYFNAASRGYATAERRWSAGTQDECSHSAVAVVASAGTLILELEAYSWDSGLTSVSAELTVLFHKKQ